MKITLQEAAAIAKKQHIEQKEKWRKYFTADSITNVDNSPTMTNNEIEKVVEKFRKMRQFHDEHPEIGDRIAQECFLVHSLLTTLTQKHEKEKAAMVREILDKQGSEEDPGYLVVPVTDIEEIAANHNVDLSKTDVTN